MTSAHMSSATVLSAPLDMSSGNARAMLESARVSLLCSMTMSARSGGLQPQEPTTYAAFEMRRASSIVGSAMLQKMLTVKPTGFVKRATTPWMSITRLASPVMERRSPRHWMEGSLHTLMVPRLTPNLALRPARDGVSMMGSVRQLMISISCEGRSNHRPEQNLEPCCMWCARPCRP